MRWVLSRRACAFGGVSLICSTFLPWVLFWSSCPPVADNCLSGSPLWWPEFTKDVVGWSQGEGVSTSPWFFSAWLAGVIVLTWTWMAPRLRRHSLVTALVVSAGVVAVAIGSVSISIWQLAWLLGYWIQYPPNYGYQNWVPGPGFVLHLVGVVFVVLGACGEFTGRWDTASDVSASLDPERSVTTL